MSFNQSAYRIHPIALCQGPRDLSFWTYCLNVGTKSTSVSHIWFIEGSNSNILVDCGARISDFDKRGLPSNKIQSPEAGLAKLGMQPGDIGIVIVTHLHFDHIALANLYTSARFIVQKKELDYALNPHPWDAYLYHQKAIKSINFELIDDEKEIIPGIKVFLTPGHSSGGQSVEINTAGGKAIITGFCCLAETFTQTEEMKRKGWEVAAPDLHQDVRKAYDSVLRVKCRADIILPLHDPSFIDKTIP